MKKKRIARLLIGIPVGISIGYLITVFGSFFWGEGEYYPCVPQFVELMGSESKAVLLQTLLSAVIGCGFAAASLIWEIESWGLVKQTGVYFLAASVILLPISYLCFWMEHTLAGFLGYFAIFAAIFALIWIISFFIGRRSVRRLNEGLRRSRQPFSRSDNPR